jgi:tRNA (Thr-GGU) A37 N-methylase
MRFEFEPIGLCRSPYTDKFGIPRQPRLVTAAEARIELLAPYDREEAFAGLERQGKRLALRIAGADLLDGTPILDIKPYVPYADAIPDAEGGFANTPPQARFQVGFSEDAHRQLAEQDTDGRLRLRALIEQVIAQDPRPGYMDRYPERREFVLQLYALEIHWQIDGDRALVTRVRPVQPATGSNTGL